MISHFTPDHLKVSSPGDLWSATPSFCHLSFFHPLDEFYQLNVSIRTTPFLRLRFSTAHLILDFFKKRGNRSVAVLSWIQSDYAYDLPSVFGRDPP